MPVHRTRWRIRRLRRFLLVWTLVPISVFLVGENLSVYRGVNEALGLAHDRLLLGTARQISDLLKVDRDGLSVDVPLALVEAIEASGGSRMMYRVTGFAGEHLAGDALLPWPRVDEEADSLRPTHYVTRVAGQRMRAVALRQPIEGSEGRGVVRVVVAESMETRERQALALLYEAIWHQLAVLAVIALVIWAVVRRGMEPLRALRSELATRDVHDVSRLASQGPEELQPVIDEMNALLQRQQHLREQQMRFVADASHQLRTPLAILSVQLQSALDEPAEGRFLLPQLQRQVARLTHLTNQLLDKAKVESAAGSMPMESLRLDAIARDAVLQLAPMIAARHLDAGVDVVGPATVRGYGWMIGELVGNLLTNAIRHSPERARLGIRIEGSPREVRLVVWDCGPGIGEALRAHLFQPFSTAPGVVGSGLGLAICQDIARSMRATLSLENRVGADGVVQGLDAIVTWPAI